MLSVNETAEKDLKPIKGIYLMTDILGNQRKVKVVPAEKSIKIELIEEAPRLKANQAYKDFLYTKGYTRLGYEKLYCWDTQNFKVYAEEYPLYYEWLSK